MERSGRRVIKAVHRTLQEYIPSGNDENNEQYSRIKEERVVCQPSALAL